MNNLYVYVVFINSFALDKAGGNNLWCGEINCLFHQDTNKSTNKKTIKLAGVYCGFRCEKHYDGSQLHRMKNEWSICI